MSGALFFTTDTMDSYTKIIVTLNEIYSITETLYKVEKRSILHVRATKIKDLSLEARQQTITLERERSDLEKQVLELRQKLARLKGEQVPEANDQCTPDLGQLWGGVRSGKKTERGDNGVS